MPLTRYLLPSAKNSAKNIVFRLESGGAIYRSVNVQHVNRYAHTRQALGTLSGKPMCYCFHGNQSTLKSRQHVLTNLETFRPSPWAWPTTTETVGASSCRFYHDGKEDDSEKKPRIKGVVFVLPNPLDWFKNKWHMGNIKKLDPHFRLDEFMHGALQAVTVVTKYLFQEDYDSLKGLLTDSAITDLKDRIQFDLGTHASNLCLEEKDVVYKNAKTWKVVEEDGNSKRMEVDTYFVALKYDVDGSDTYMMELGFNFSRDYIKDGDTSDWIIDGVSHFQVREFKAGKPRKPR